MNMFDLTGRVAVVTGGNGGIGLGIARDEHYAAAKASLNALCRALGVELARYGVTANAILPGWIKSDMTARIMAEEKFVGAVMPRIPMRRTRRIAS